MMKHYAARELARGCLKPLTTRRAQGCTQIELSSSESRVRAHHFYDAQGYREVRKRFVKRPV
ncbi:hypothetical protein ESA_01924 [Cronobacter sakazakii ATCC BAA-894]|uniref:GNAT family N-acetyltransferase n=1 Tax=Cronobacter sakazakii (strain ATCC BAA-894) TaxID=290339 RepID=A7MPX9_CROS8|nr:hypothetical protein ESA_01924 [Cronobacter sakazakii ATCC BAA-894]